MLTPDRKPDMGQVSPMADEIPLANVVRLERVGRAWTARIGPPGAGIAATGGTWAALIRRLVSHAEYHHWPIDEGWRDRME